MLAEFVGVAVVMPIAYCIGKLNQDLPLTSEILSRTDPGIFDLIIALAGGAAGAYAAVSPRLSTGVVGVAISTALVPPLAACGICLARNEHLPCTAPTRRPLTPAPASWGRAFAIKS